MESIFSSVIQLATAIQTSQLSAREALDAHLKQIENHNPALNAVVTLNVERAYERAKEADEAQAHGTRWGPLHGVPYALKDAHATADVRTTTGVPFLDHIPGDDSTVAARLKAAGGILIGKTNVAAMLGDPAQTDNPIFGRTRNPWNLERTPGGSSGGAAAAVASGMTPFDIGTDLAGSIRIPAHFCGVLGLKPTEHRVSLVGLIPGLPPPRSIRIMSCIGPIARTVEDLALLYQIIAGPDGQDTDVSPVPVADVPEVELKALRIAYAPTFPDLPVAADVRHAIERLAGQLSSGGALVEEAAFPALDYDQTVRSAGELVGMMLGAFQPESNQSPTTLAHYLEALHRRDQVITAWEQFFNTWDVLLCPPAMMTAFPHCDTGAPLSLDGQPIEYWAIGGHATLFNYTGHPAVVLPYQLDRDGLPIGVQIVGKRWADSRLLAIARALSQVTGEFGRPSGY